jgi:CO dehydrogenase maturation factor
MKIAVAGKGGAGKSTIVSLMARVLSEQGKKVIIIDADPDMNQASLLGVPGDVTITPVSELKELIAERTGTVPGQPAPLFTMNPKVSDIPSKYSVTIKDITLLTMGTIKRGGGGCACPENAFIKSLISHLFIAREEWVILDMEAGIEHLGRGTALGVDQLIVIVEPTKTSIATAHRVKKLAQDIGIKKIMVAGNKIGDEEDKQIIKTHLPGYNILGFIEYSNDIKKISSFGKSVFSAREPVLEQISSLINALG